MGNAVRVSEPVLRWINGKNPMQYGFDFGLWTRQIVGELIAQRFAVRLSLRLDRGATSVAVQRWRARSSSIQALPTLLTAE